MKENGTVLRFHSDAHLAFSLLNVVSFIAGVSRLQANRVLLKLPHLKTTRRRNRF